MKRAISLALGALMLCTVSCGDDDGGVDSGRADSGVADSGAGDAGRGGICAALNTSETFFCLDDVDTQDDFASIGLRVGASQRVAKFVMPARTGVLPAVAFMATSRFMLHVDFLKAAFPETFGALVGGDYPALFLEEERSFIAGSISESEGRYSFSVVESQSVPASLVTRDIAIEVWTHLQPRFGLASLSFLALSDRQRDAAATWSDLPFAVEGVATDYQAYNTGRGCGYVRVVALSDLPARIESGALSFRDLLVLDGAPADLERIVSAIVTQEPQGPLSHLAVRSASRGTPNAFLRDPAVLTTFENMLVCLDVGSEGIEVSQADLATAEEFWDSIRPLPVVLDEPNTVIAALPSLRELSVGSAEERRAAIRTYGAKGTNLALLYQSIDVHDGYRGLLIPAHYYARFAEENTWLVDLGGGVGSHTFAETLDTWLADEALQADSALLRMRLNELRAAMVIADVPADIVSSVYDAVTNVYGTNLTTVRFRSSSNAEDALGFSGAGLYDSTSVCPADSTDGDDVGPSRCDAGRRNERSIERGLRRVWSSLWKPSAFEERAWYGMDQSRAVMSILVNDRAGDELANVVAFSGNPTGNEDDTRMLLTAQVGDVDLVSPDPGTRPESLLLEREGGAITGIDRIAQSTETAGRVLSDANARAIGSLLLSLESSFPIDEPVPEGRRVLLDTEWKVLADGTLVIKQIRLFLR